MLHFKLYREVPVPVIETVIQIPEENFGTGSGKVDLLILCCEAAPVWSEPEWPIVFGSFGFTNNTEINTV